MLQADLLREMRRQMVDIEAWIEENFANAAFTDKRRNKRLCKTAKAMMNQPDASLPQQMPLWADLKGAYRFLSHKESTHKRIQVIHNKRVAQESIIPNQTTLFYQDSSDLDYTNHSKVKGIGPIGNHLGLGMMFHSCLAVHNDEQGSRLIGLAHQQVWIRKHISLNRVETKHQRNKRKDKESAVWGKTLDTLKLPPEGCKWVSIGDRASDIYEYHLKIFDLGWHSLIRACQDRVINVNGEKDTLIKRARSLKEMGSKNINIRRQVDTTKKQISLKVAWEQIAIAPPARVKKGHPSLTLWVIRAWNEEEDLDWILISTLPIENMQDAEEKLNWYAGRWIIEEYHKCLKTGCKIEERQLGTAHALKALLSIFGVLAVCMLQLREVARTAPDTLASTEIPNSALILVCKRFGVEKSGLSVRTFWRCVAKLGGFIGRKSDGEPGWQTLWKGWMRLLDMLWAVEPFLETC